MGWYFMGVEPDPEMDGIQARGIAKIYDGTGDHGPACECGHPPGTRGPCAGCNCADACPMCGRIGEACVCSDAPRERAAK